MALFSLDSFNSLGNGPAAYNQLVSNASGYSYAQRTQREAPQIPTLLEVTIHPALFFCCVVALINTFSHLDPHLGPQADHPLHGHMSTMWESKSQGEMQRRDMVARSYHNSLDQQVSAQYHSPRVSSLLQFANLASRSALLLAR